MVVPIGSRDQRNELRINSDLPATISVGSQLTIQGHLKDLSLKSAFITIKHSVFLETNEQIGFSIQCSLKHPNSLIEGLARISRIVPGEGLAIYFTDMNTASELRLKKLLNS